MECLEKLSGAELEDLRDWEASPAFTKTGDWPGFLPLIGPRPSQSEERRLGPALVRRRA